MTIATVDDKKRVRLPSAKPGAVLAIQENSDGSILLCPVKVDRPEAFPPGSLLEYIAERDADPDVQDFAKNTVIGTPADAYPDDK